MRIVLVTTTINVPEILREYRRIGPDVEMLVAGDLKSPHDEMRKFARSIGDCGYLDPSWQEQHYPVLSKTIGWNSIQRRNIAILAAAKMKPDVIVTIDDDNIPRNESYFDDIRAAFSQDHRGSVAGSRWFNLGELAHHPYRYRGLPYSADATGILITSNNSGQRLGVLNGLIYGDPDINATQRIEQGPQVSWYSDAARDGIALIPEMSWSPVNSQNTAWRTELAPLMLLPPQVGRYDDIWGSYIAQRVLEATDFCVRFGRPFVTQERNEHDLVRDLENELFGMRHTEELVSHLKSVPISKEATMLQNLRAVLTSLRELPFPLPHKFFDAWLQACEAL